MKRRNVSAAKPQLVAAIGFEIVRFQEATNHFDELAARVLGVQRDDLKCLSLLLFAGPFSAEQLPGALKLAASHSQRMILRLQRAGYIERGRGQVSLTAHARQWVETIWGPLQRAGEAVLARHSIEHLEVMAKFMAEVAPIHVEHANRLAHSLTVPGGKASNTPWREGLSPAALRRVELLVEANLANPIHLADLAARAELSAFHFARGFKSTTGVTPRAYLEQRRVACAERLLRETTMPLVEVASASGLGSQSRFTTIFRRSTGLTPAAFRRAETPTAGFQAADMGFKKKGRQQWSW